MHFEIPADDVQMARKFYHEIFGWKINAYPDMEYTIFNTAPTDEKGMSQEPGFINGGMMKREGELKNPIITIDVPDIEKAFDKIVAQGGKIIRKKMDVGDMG